VGDHSHDPTYYNNVIPSTELPILTLDAVDFEDSMALGARGYLPSVFAPGSHTYMHMFIISYPTKGALYYLNGTLISQSQLPVMISRAFIASSNGSDVNGDGTRGEYVHGVRYRPRQNEHSEDDNEQELQVYTSFAFTAVDGLTGEGSLETAVVNILVEAVNQPPLPRFNLTAVAMAGALIPIDLQGVDTDSSIAYATITTSPAAGELFRASDTSSTAVGTGATVSTDSSSSSGQRVIQYRYSGTGSTPDPLTGFIDTDTFTYTVTDSSGFESVVGIITVYITSAVVAYNSEAPVTVLESPYVNIVTIHGHDFTRREGSELVLRVKITQLPTHGQLYQYPAYISSGGIEVESLIPVLTVGTLSHSSSNASNIPLRFLYIGAPYFFTTPSTNWEGLAIPPDDSGGGNSSASGSSNITTGANPNPNPNTTTTTTVDEHFTYCLVSTDADSAPDAPIIGQSTEHNITLTVRNLNTPIELTLAPDASLPYRPRGEITEGGVLTIHALTVSSGGSTDTSSTSTDATTPPTFLQLNTVIVTDRDRGTDPIRVEITTTHGLVTLNRENIEVLDFNSQFYCLGAPPLGCAGDGAGDKVAKFVTSAAGLQQALKGLVYEVLN